MALTSGGRAILSVFGPMLDTALAVGRGAQGMWQTFTDAYRRVGQDRPPASIQDMNGFVSWLGSVVRSMKALGRLRNPDAIMAEHIAAPFGYTTTAADQAAPSLLATFKVQVQTDVGVLERWSSIAYHGLLPVTAGDVRNDAVTATQAQMDAAAAEEGENSPMLGGTVIGVSDMYLLGKGF